MRQHIQILVKGDAFNDDMMQELGGHLLDIVRCLHDSELVSNNIKPDSCVVFLDSVTFERVFKLIDLSGAVQLDSGASHTMTSRAQRTSRRRLPWRCW